MRTVPQILSAAALIGLSAASANASIMRYQENFVTAANQYAVKDVGWIGHSAGADKDLVIGGVNHGPIYVGQNISASTADPMYIVKTDANAPDGDSHRTFLGSGGTSDQLLWTDEYTVPLHLVNNSLEFSWQHLTTGNGTSRLAIRMDDAGTDRWFIHDVAAGSAASWTKVNFLFTSAGTSWREMTDFTGSETTDDPGGFALPVSTYGGTLPSGPINAFGMYLQVGANANDRERIDAFQIVSIPEPTLGLLVICSTVLVRRRR
jgi:hypothetical protein